jgi:hypothetical protein
MAAVKQLFQLVFTLAAGQRKMFGKPESIDLAIYRGRFEMAAVKRLSQLDFTPAARQRKMPTA